MNVAREGQRGLTDGCPPLQFIYFRNWPWSPWELPCLRGGGHSHIPAFLWLSSDPLLERKLSTWVLFLGFSTYLPCTHEALLCRVLLWTWSQGSYQAWLQAAVAAEDGPPLGSLRPLPRPLYGIPHGLFCWWAPCSLLGNRPGQGIFPYLKLGPHSNHGRQILLSCFSWLIYSKLE